MSLQKKLVNQLHNIGREAEEISASISKNRVLPTALIDKLKETGAFKLWVAKS